MSAPNTTPAFTHIAGEVFWSSGGPLVLTTDTMRADLIEMITEAGHDSAQAGSVDGVRQATRLLNELNTACRAAREWIEAGRINA